MTSQDRAVPGYSSSATSSQHTYPQIILFGDSITQEAESTFAAGLRQRYLRKADIVNRGLSGYTSKLGLDVLPKIFPGPREADVRIVTVFFGANDACLPDNAQHVPIEVYASCMRSIVQHDLIQSAGTKVVLIVPGPVDEYQMNNGQRTAANTRRYADACRRVGQELRLPMVDLWSIFMKQAGWDGSSDLIGSKDCAKSEVLDELLSDGLHFTAKAYSILLREMMKIIQEQLSELAPGALPMVFPAWSDLLVSNKETD